MKDRSFCFRLLSVVAIGPLISLCLEAQAKQTDVKPEDGETQLDKAATEAVLKSIKEWFGKSPFVKAKIRSEVADGLLGKRVEKGELILRRQDPEKALRRFTEPSRKATMLAGKELRRYDPATKKVVVRDFTPAPKALALLRTAAGLGFEGWRDHFAVTAFKKAPEGEPAEWRFVLTPRKDKKSIVAKDFKSIQVRIAENGAFFSEIKQVPKGRKRNPVTEFYSDIQVLKELPESAFKEELLEKPDKVKEDVPAEEVGK